MVIITASTLPAVKASIEGGYSNQTNSTSTPASLNQPFWMPISNAVQPGQSLKATRSGAFAGGGGGVAACGGAAAGAGGGGSLVQAASMAVRAARARKLRFFMSPRYEPYVAGMYRVEAEAVK